MTHNTQGGIARWRTKSFEVEAIKLTFENQDEVKKWCNGKTWSRPPMRAVTGISFENAEGTNNVCFGDWVVRFFSGEFHTCKPEVFEEIYESPLPASPEGTEDVKAWIEAEAEKQEVYPGKRSGDRNAFNTIMMYEINDHRSECFEKGAWAVYDKYIQPLQQENEQRGRQIESMTGTIMRLQADQQELKQENERLKEVVEAQDNQLYKRLEQITALQSQLAEAREALRKIAENRDRMKQSLNLIIEEIPESDDYDPGAVILAVYRHAVYGLQKIIV